MTPNHGQFPTEAAGRRIRGVLANGMRFGFAPVSDAAPAGWRADTTRWTRDGHPYDVAEFEVIR